MATSKHLAIRAAVAALFAAAPALAGNRIFPNREYALPAGVDSQIHVNRVDADPEGEILTGAPIDWVTQLEVVIKARKVNTTDAEDVADEIWTAAYARLMADQTLGGLVGLLTQGQVSFDQDEADTDVAVITWRFTVTHRTANNSIA
jgi:hypothetical protein